METINVAIGANIAGLNAGLSEAASAVKGAGEKMVGSAVEVEAKTTEAFFNLKQAYRAAAKDAQSLAVTQGTSSAAFIEAATKAGNYKNELDDVVGITKALSSDTPVLSASLGVAQGLAGGFAAAQGAMALFGGSGEDLQKSMVKLQAAMALVSGLQALGGLKDGFTALSATIASKVIPALASMGIAISATGIGLIVVAVATLAAGFYLMGDAADEAAAAAGRLKDATKKIEDEEKNITKILDETTALRLKAIKDGKDKEIEVARVTYKQQLDALVASHQSGQIAENTYLQRKKYLHQIYLNEIEAAEEKHKAKPKKTKRADLDFNEIKVKQIPDGFFTVPPTMKIFDDQMSKIRGNLKLLVMDFQNMPNNIQQPFSKIELFFAELGQKVGGWSNMMSQAITTMSVNLGAAIATGDFKTAGEQVVKMLGGMAIQIGGAMIAMGIPLAMATATASEGIRMIAGGTILAGIGGAMQASGQAPKGKGAGGGGGGSGSGSLGTPNSFRPSFEEQQFLMLNGMVRGQDLVIATSNTNANNRRVR